MKSSGTDWNPSFSSTILSLKSISAFFSREVGVWREIRNQYIAVINMVLTIGGTFAFVFKAVEYSLPVPNPAAQTLLGILACLVVAVAELYFLLRDL